MTRALKDFLLGELKSFSLLPTQILFIAEPGTRVSITLRNISPFSAGDSVFGSQNSLPSLSINPIYSFACEQRLSTWEQEADGLLEPQVSINKLRRRREILESPRMRAVRTCKWMRARTASLAVRTWSDLYIGSIFASDIKVKKKKSFHCCFQSQTIKCSVDCLYF